LRKNMKNLCIATWIWSRSNAYTRETKNCPCQCCLLLGKQYCQYQCCMLNRTAVLSVSVSYMQATELQYCQYQFCTCKQQNYNIVNISSLYLTLFQSGFCFRFILVLSFYLHLWLSNFMRSFCVTICNVFFLFRACGFSYLLYISSLM
jgi:hypothetical protein